MKTKTKKCKAGTHRFNLNSVPWYFCEKCGIASYEYDFENKRNLSKKESQKYLNEFNSDENKD